MFHVLKDKTILEFIIWLIGVAKKYEFDVSRYDNGIPTEFDVNKEFKSLNNAQSRLLVLSKIDERTGLSYMDAGRIIIEKVENGTRVEFKPNGYYGSKEIQPIIDEFVEYWANLKYIKKEKLTIYDVEKFKLDLAEVMNNGKLKTHEISKNDSESEIEQWRKDYKKYIPNKNKNHEIIELYHKNLTAPQIGKELHIGKVKDKFQRVKNLIRDMRNIAFDNGGEELANSILPYRKGNKKNE